MKNTTIWLFLFSLINFSADGQILPPLFGPTITKQLNKIETNQNTPVAIQFSDLQVADLLVPYPNGYTMTLYSGSNYTFADNVVTPALDYKGKLDVDVTVNDGFQDSPKFSVRIDVKEAKNVAPLITDQANPLTTLQETPITINLTDLKVTDPDNTYPTGFTLKIDSGPNYTRDNNTGTVTPNTGFTGNLKVTVTVNDGQDESNKFDVTIVVTPKNQKPVITAAKTLSTFIATPVSIQLTDLTITDNDPPGSQTLTLYNGPGYTVSGNTVTPTGTTPTTLSVPVSVFDGVNTSDKFNVTIQVTAKPNVKPKITGQIALKTQVQTPITFQSGDITVDDPDNNYPDDFKITLYAGAGYTLNGLTITPTGNAPTTLSVPVSINDGTVESDKFSLQITVEAKPNVKPQILSQKTALTTTSNTPITLGLLNLNVQDPDNVYPDDFTMKIQGGANYTVNNLTITPTPGFIGTLSVPVTVNDGKIDSDPFPVVITVNAIPNHVPAITGQAALTTFVSVPITLRVTSLSVDDPDNTFPDDFTLKVYPGAGYTFSGTTVTPNLLFIGTLSVNVTVNDGKNESAQYPLKVTVNLVPNVAPKITGQQELSTNINKSINIEFGNLTVEDPDNVYPTGFKMTLYSNGPNYTFSGTTVIPAAGFEGNLSVPVTVNDGVNESGKFNLKIAVTKSPNVGPVITAQLRDDYNVDEDKTFQITLDMLRVTDPDNTYPKDFTLKITAPGSDAAYSANGDKVTPNANYNGALSIPLTVNDGTVDSNPFAFKLKVNPINDPPKVIRQKNEITTLVQTPVELKLEDLEVSDPDNDPLTLKVLAGTGDNYTFTGNTIKPGPNVTGDLKVNITVSDGKVSVPFQMTVRVLNKPNVAPVIVGQDPDPLPGVQNTELTVKILDLKITDDQDDKTRFAIKLTAGANYTVRGAVIIPNANYLGTLTVPVVVNDGTDDSKPYNLKVMISPPSAKPTITGQNPIASDEDTPYTIAFSDLLVTDTDDVYPKGFKLQIVAGAGYTFSGTTVTPAKDFNGFMLVTVTVTDKDGKVSNPYGLAILVRPVDDAPVITQFETNDLNYEPGKDPIIITSIFEVKDVDNDNLSFAEVGIDHKQFQKGFDQLLFENTTNIRGFLDPDSGKLSLIGFASIQEYQDAIRSIKYNYDLTQVDPGQTPPLPGNKTIYVFVNDGQKASATVKRNIIMETNVSINIPTAFSPNDDNVNETWQVVALSNAEQCQNAVVRVYDKRGLLLFHSVGIEKKWDGKYNGQLLPTDTYYYTVDLMLSYAKKTYKGAVTIVR